MNKKEIHKFITENYIACTCGRIVLKENEVKLPLEVLLLKDGDNEYIFPRLSSVYCINCIDSPLAIINKFPHRINLFIKLLNENPLFELQLSEKISKYILAKQLGKDQHPGHRWSPPPPLEGDEDGMQQKGF